MYARSPTRVKRRFGARASERAFAWSGGGFEAVVPLAVQDAPAGGSKSQTKIPSSSTTPPASSRNDTRQCATPRSPDTAIGSTSVRSSVGTPPSTHARTIASRPRVSSRKGP